LHPFIYPLFTIVRVDYGCQARTVGSWSEDIVDLSGRRSCHGNRAPETPIVPNAFQ
jgi:hypothetical protein